MEDFLKKIDQELKINLTNVFQEIRKMQQYYAKTRKHNVEPSRNSSYEKCKSKEQNRLDGGQR